MHSTVLCQLRQTPEMTSTCFRLLADGINLDIGQSFTCYGWVHRGGKPSPCFGGQDAKLLVQLSDVSLEVQAHDGTPSPRAIKVLLFAPSLCDLPELNSGDIVRLANAQVCRDQARRKANTAGGGSEASAQEELWSVSHDKRQQHYGPLHVNLLQAKKRSWSLTVWRRSNTDFCAQENYGWQHVLGSSDRDAYMFTLESRDESRTHPSNAYNGPQERPLNERRAPPTPQTDALGDKPSAAPESEATPPGGARDAIAHALEPVAVSNAAAAPVSDGIVQQTATDQGTTTTGGALRPATGTVDEGDQKALGTGGASARVHGAAELTGEVLQATIDSRFDHDSQAVERTTAGSSFADPDPAAPDAGDDCGIDVCGAFVHVIPAACDATEQHAVALTQDPDVAGARTCRPALESCAPVPGVGSVGGVRSGASARLPLQDKTCLMDRQTAGAQQSGGVIGTGRGIKRRAASMDLEPTTQASTVACEQASHQGVADGAAPDAALPASTLGGALKDGVDVLGFGPDVESLSSIDARVYKPRHVVLQVLAVTRWPVQRGRDALPVAFVWDGTDPCTVGVPRDGVHLRDPAYLELSSIRCRSSQDMPLCATDGDCCDVLEDMPSWGAAVPLLVLPSCLSAFGALIPTGDRLVGKWLAFRGIHVRMCEGQMQLVMTASTTCRVLPGESERLTTSSRQRSNCDSAPPCHFKHLAALPACWQSEPILSLRQVLLAQSRAQTAGGTLRAYRCLLQILDWSVWDLAGNSALDISSVQNSTIMRQSLLLGQDRPLALALRVADTTANAHILLRGCDLLLHFQPLVLHRADSLGVCLLEAMPAGLQSIITGTCGGEPGSSFDGSDVHGHDSPDRWSAATLQAMTGQLDAMTQQWAEPRRVDMLVTARPSFDAGTGIGGMGWLGMPCDACFQMIAPS